MEDTIKLSQLIKSSAKYDLTIFSKESIDAIEENIFEKNNKYFLTCLKRNKHIQAKPEEIVRQLMLDKLIREYEYSKDLLEVEYTVNFGTEKKYADIVILNQADKTSVYCILEIKKHKGKDGKEQLKSYTNATGSPLAVWTNGVEIAYYERLDPNYFEPLSDIPKANEKIEDIKDERFTYLELMQKDRLSKERKSLKSLIEEIEDEVLANAGVDIFEEVFKLIFTKLYDEMESSNDRLSIETQFKLLKKQNPKFTDKKILLSLDNEDFRNLEFRSRGDAHYTKAIINKLFEKAKTNGKGFLKKANP